MTEPATILVTGGAGFIGSAAVRELLAHDYRYAMGFSKLRDELGSQPRVSRPA